MRPHEIFASMSPEQTEAFFTRLAEESPVMFAQSVQAAAIAMIAFGRMHLDPQGQVFVIFILTVAAAEAALALGLVVLLYRRKPTLDAEAWSELKEC